MKKAFLIYLGFIALLISSATIAGVQVYDESQYQGYSQDLGPGWYDWGSIHNDTISSLRVPSGYSVTLYNDTRFGGTSQTFTSDSSWIGEYMNDKTSSLVVRYNAPKQTSWNCFLNNGKFVNRVNITWGHTPWDASWACNEWLSECGNNGGCRATGDAPGRSCNLYDRIDGCSAPLSDALSNAAKIIFMKACNNHDTCYHAPWNAIGRDGLQACNDNFWNDMGNACAQHLPSGTERFTCELIRSTWGTAMNVSGDFRKAYNNNQNWVRENCVQ